MPLLESVFSQSQSSPTSSRLKITFHLRELLGPPARYGCQVLVQLGSFAKSAHLRAQQALTIQPEPNQGLSA